MSKHVLCKCYYSTCHGFRILCHKQCMSSTKKKQFNFLSCCISVNFNLLQLSEEHQKNELVFPLNCLLFLIHWQRSFFLIHCPSVFIFAYESKCVLQIQYLKVLYKCIFCLALLSGQLFVVLEHVLRLHSYID